MLYHLATRPRRIKSLPVSLYKGRSPPPLGAVRPQEPKGESFPIQSKLYQFHLAWQLNFFGQESFYLADDFFGRFSRPKSRRQFVSAAAEGLGNFPYIHSPVLLGAQ